MINYIEKNVTNYKIKLYVSCINECPIEGKIDKKKIINEIEYYMNSNLNEVCLSDTCGTLKAEDFIDIIESSSIDNYSKLSLHLHYSDDDNLLEILSYCIKKGILRYDVSYLENSGGCSVTMDDKKINSNLHYDKINELLDKIYFFEDNRYRCGHLH